MYVCDETAKKQVCRECISVKCARAQAILNVMKWLKKNVQRMHKCVVNMQELKLYCM